MEDFEVMNDVVKRLDKDGEDDALLASLRGFESAKMEWDAFMKNPKNAKSAMSYMDFESLIHLFSETVDQHKRERQEFLEAELAEIKETFGLDFDDYETKDNYMDAAIQGLYYCVRYAFALGFRRGRKYGARQKKRHIRDFYKREEALSRAMSH